MSDSVEVSDTINWDSENNSLDYELWEAQTQAYKEFVSGDHHIVNFRAGYRGGKSVLGARILIMLAMKYQRSRWLTVAESFAEGRESTYKVLYNQLPEVFDVDDVEDCPLVDTFIKHKKIKFVNGSVIVLGTAQKPDRHKGDEFSGIWADEVARFNNLYDLTKMLLSRLSARKGSLTMLWTTTTDGYNDYYTVTEEGLIPNQEKEHGWNIKTIVADSRNNPYLTEDALQHAISIHSASKTEGLKGGFSPAEGRVYDNFNRGQHTVEYSDIKDELVEEWRIYGVDLGWNDPKICLEFGKTSYGQLVVLDEFYRSESYIEDVIEWLEEKPSGHLYTDYNYKDDVQKMRESEKLDHIVVREANKSIDSGIDKVRKRIESDGERVGLLVCERANYTIQEFLSYKESDVGGNNVDDHCMDSLRYAINSPQQSIMNADDTDSESSTTVINTVTSMDDARGRSGRGSRDSI